MSESVNVAIVEDDEETRNKLGGYFVEFGREFGVEFRCYAYGDGESFLDDGAKRSLDIVIMDIELPGADGMETVRALRERDRNVIVIFATNMAQFAVKGYEVEAFDFMVKPVTYPLFSVKIRRALERFDVRRDKAIWINVTGGGRKQIRTSELKYIEVMGHKITYHTTDGDLVASGSMIKVQEALRGLPFELCNRCYLVNLKFVTEIRPFQVIVGGDELQISHLKRNDFLSKLNAFLAGSGGGGRK